MKYFIFAVLLVFSGCRPPAIARGEKENHLVAENLPSGYAKVVNQTTLPGEAGYAIRHQKTGIILVWVPGGSFQMGVTPEMTKELWQKWGKGQVERFVDISSYAPPHRVEVKGFWIGPSEVTIGQYCQIMGSPAGRVFSFNQEEPEKSKPECDLITDITWQEAQRFSKKLGLRLPTEEEWEYSARGPGSSLFPWGNDFSGEEDDVSWCGALNLARGVREWADGEIYGRKVIRGGMDGDRQPYSAFAFNRRSIFHERVENIGFRVARDD